MEQVAAEKRAIDQTYHQLVLGRERERERLARELHDETIQSLIGFKFRLAEKVQETQPELQDELNKVVASLRGICADLRPPALEALGLIAVLRSNVEEFSVRTGLIVEFTVEGEERRFSPEAELSLFRGCSRGSDQCLETCAGTESCGQFEVQDGRPGTGHIR